MAKSESHWRRISQERIAAALAALPADADLDAKRRALRDAYPFGERAHHPYRIWCDEQRKALGKASANVELKVGFELVKHRTASPRCWYISFRCDYCRHVKPPNSETIGCLMCLGRHRIIDELFANPEFVAGLRTVRDLPNDSFRRGVLADWLAEHGYDELAELFYASMDESPATVPA